MHPVYRVLPALLIPLFISLTGAGQDIVPRFETIDVEKGLSQNSVYRIYQDKQGFMWFGTADGLNRYDGNTIRIFKYKAPSITYANSNAVRGLLLEDQQGRIWYANETGIYFYNLITEKIEQAYDFLTKEDSGFVYYYALALDGHGNFWLLNPGLGIARYSIHTNSFETFKFPKSMKPEEYAVNPQTGHRYFYLQVPNRAGVLRFDRVTQKYDWIFQDLVNVRVIAESTHLFITGDATFFYYDSTQHRLQTLPIQTTNSISYAIQDASGRYWITTRGDGLHSFTKQDILRVYRNDRAKPYPLPSNITSTMYIDVDQNLWIGTDGGGVSRLDLKSPRFNSFSPLGGDYPELKDYFIRCFFEDDLGRIWFGTLQDGFVIYDPNTGILRKYSQENGLSGHSVGSIYRDRAGNIWIGHNQGVSRFNETTGKFYWVPIEPMQFFKMEDNQVTQITELPSGELLMTCAYGIYKIEKDEQGQYRGTNWKEFTSRTVGITQTPDGHYWVASQVEGLYQVKPNEPFVQNSKQFFSRINLKSIHRDEQDPTILWLCSGAGLIRFDTQTSNYTLYDEQAGIPGSFVYGLLEDDHHNFWLSTNAGLCFWDRTTNTVTNFTVNDGLQSNEFNTGAFHKGRSGTLYFGGIKGFNWFRTGAEKNRQDAPRTAIVGITVNDAPVAHDSLYYYSQQVSLPYDQNDLELEVAVLAYSMPGANRIRYQLEGWDNRAVISNQKTVRYPNLPPGDYVFRVSGSQSRSDWGPEAQVRITIQAPFWKTNLFYGLVGVIALALVIGTVRFLAHQKFEKRVQEIEKQKAVLIERERISKDIHDDLGTGLSKISILSELAKQSQTTDEFTQRQLTKISESSHELIDNLGELIWSHNPANDSLKKLFWYIREHLSPVFDSTSTVLKLSLPELPSDIVVPAAWRRNVFLAVKESLHNVLKHAQASQVELDFTVMDNTVHISISDNGKGFDPDRLTPGNGLINLKKRMADCGGTVSLESKPGTGTRVQLIVPIV